MPAEDWAFESIATFATHSLIACIGSDHVADRTAKYASYAAGSDETEVSAQPHGAAEVDGEGMDVVDDSAATAGSSSGGNGNSNDTAEPALKTSISLAQALEKYDNGESYEGSFPVCPSWNVSTVAVSREKVEAHVRKSVQMLSQVCVAEPSMLAVFFALYGAAAACAAREYEALVQAQMKDGANGPSSSANEGATSESKEPPSTVEGSEKTATAPSGDTTQQKQAPPKDETKFGVMCHVLERELDGIIPVASKRVGSLHLLSYLARADMDPLSRRLLERTLELMHADYSLPASTQLVERVNKYIADGVVGANEGVSEEEIDEVTVKLLVPVAGGMSTQDALGLLPKVVRVLDDQSDALMNAFRRMYLARPPPVSKAALFAALHRYVQCYVNYQYALIKYIFMMCI